MKDVAELDPRPRTNAGSAARRDIGPTSAEVEEAAEMTAVATGDVTTREIGEEAAPHTEQVAKNAEAAGHPTKAAPTS